MVFLAAPLGIGFVWRICPALVPPSPGLGPRGTAGNWLCLARLPSGTGGIVKASGLGDGPAVSHRAELALFRRGLSNVLFTITLSPQGTCPCCCSGGNWLCFARSARLAPRYPSPPKFGFVWHISPSTPPADCRNWLCSAELPCGRHSSRPRLGLFAQRTPGTGGRTGFVCTTDRAQRPQAASGPIGFVCSRRHAPGGCARQIGSVCTTEPGTPR
jgi:hypothetical protein